MCLWILGGFEEPALRSLKFEGNISEGVHSTTASDLDCRLGAKGSSLFVIVRDFFRQFTKHAWFRSNGFSPTSLDGVVSGPSKL